MYYFTAVETAVPLLAVATLAAIPFWAQFSMLVMTFKALSGIRNHTHIPPIVKQGPMYHRLTLADSGPCLLLHHFSGTNYKKIQLPLCMVYSRV